MVPYDNTAGYTGNKNTSRVLFHLQFQVTPEILDTSPWKQGLLKSHMVIWDEGRLAPSSKHCFHCIPEGKTDSNCLNFGYNLLLKPPHLGIFNVGTLLITDLIPLIVSHLLTIPNSEEKHKVLQWCFVK